MKQLAPPPLRTDISKGQNASYPWQAWFSDLYARVGDIYTVVNNFVTEGVNYLLKPATSTTIGGVIVGDNINVDANGKISVEKGSGYELPVASGSNLGGVKIGIGITKSADGTISIEEVVQNKDHDALENRQKPALSADDSRHDATSLWYDGQGISRYGANPYGSGPYKGYATPGMTVDAALNDLYDNKPSPYSLPIATTTVLGGIKPDNTTITVDPVTAIASVVVGGVYAPLSFKTNLDALNGLIKGSGVGAYSAVTDNSTNWNTAYAWGDWRHTTLSQYGITDACSSTDSRLSDSRTPTAHVLDGALHSISGKTPGHFLKALTATTFGFAAHGLTYSDVGADQSGAAAARQAAYTNLTSIGSLANASGWLHNNGSGTFAYSTPSYSDVGASPALSLTTGYIPKAASATTLGNSPISVSGTNVGVDSGYQITINGGALVAHPLIVNTETSYGIEVVSTSTSTTRYLLNVYYSTSVQAFFVRSDGLMSSSGTFFSDTTSKPNISLQSAGSNYGLIQNAGTGIWALGYGATKDVLGTSVLTWNSSGNVGVGTTGPGAKLHIQDISGKTTIGGSTALTIGGKSAGSAVGERLELNFKTWNSFTKSTAAIGVITTDTAGAEAGDLYFAVKNGTGSVAPTEVMRITNNGNVGIGYTSPLSALCVNGGVNIGGQAAVATNGLRLSYDDTHYGSLYSDATGNMWMNSVGGYVNSLANIAQYHNSANSTPGYLYFYKSRGTYASPEDVVNGDGLGTICFYGYKNSEYRESARIATYCDIAPGASSINTDMVFYSHNDSSLVAGLGINHNAEVRIFRTLAIFDSGAITQQSGTISINYYNSSVFTWVPAITPNGNFVVTIDGTPPNNTIIFVHAYNDSGYYLQIGGCRFAGSCGYPHRSGIIQYNNGAWRKVSDCLGDY